jgi:hypothetical protein
VELHHLVLHGGWEGSQVCTIFVYLLCLRCYILVTARALANHKDVHRHVFPPSMRSFRQTLNQGQQIVLDNAINAVFKVSNPSFQTGGKLRPLLDVCFATFLRYYDPMVLQSGLRHESILYFTTTVQTFGLDVNLMRKSVLEDYAWNNAVAVATTSESTSSVFHEEATAKMSLMKGELEQLRLQTRTFQDTITKEVLGQGKTLANIEKMVQEIHQNNRQQAMSPTQPRKRQATQDSLAVDDSAGVGGTADDVTATAVVDGIVGMLMYDAVTYVLIIYV